jgi:RNA polymerase sigma-70 factor, ECF subfamily
LKTQTPDQSEAHLVARIAAQDASAFALLIEQHHGWAYRLAWRICGQQRDAEDIVQEAFLKLWTKAAHFDSSRGQFKSWFARIITNQALDGRRQLKPIETLEAAYDIADSAPTPEQCAQHQDVHRALATLPARQRAALALFYMDGFTMVEVAALLETNEKAVESLLSRGRAALRALWSKTPEMRLQR